MADNFGQMLMQQHHHNIAAHGSGGGMHPTLMVVRTPQLDYVLPAPVLCVPGASDAHRAVDTPLRASTCWAVGGKGSLCRLLNRSTHSVHVPRRLGPATQSTHIRCTTPRSMLTRSTK